MSASPTSLAQSPFQAIPQHQTLVQHIFVHDGIAISALQLPFPGHTEDVKPRCLGQAAISGAGANLVRNAWIETAVDLFALSPSHLTDCFTIEFFGAVPAPRRVAELDALQSNARGASSASLASPALPADAGKAAPAGMHAVSNFFAVHPAASSSSASSAYHSDGGDGLGSGGSSGVPSPATATATTATAPALAPLSLPSPTLGPSLGPSAATSTAHKAPIPLSLRLRLQSDSSSGPGPGLGPGAGADPGADPDATPSLTSLGSFGSAGGTPFTPFSPRDGDTPGDGTELGSCKSGSTASNASTAGYGHGHSHSSAAAVSISRGRQPYIVRHTTPSHSAYEQQHQQHQHQEELARRGHGHGHGQPRSRSVDVAAGPAGNRTTSHSSHGSHSIGHTASRRGSTGSNSLTAAVGQLSSRSLLGSATGFGSNSGSFISETPPGATPRSGGFTARSAESKVSAEDTPRTSCLSGDARGSDHFHSSGGGGSGSGGHAGSSSSGHGRGGSMAAASHGGGGLLYGSSGSGLQPSEPLSMRPVVSYMGPSSSSAGGGGGGVAGGWEMRLDSDGHTGFAVCHEPAEVPAECEVKQPPAAARVYGSFTYRAIIYDKGAVTVLIPIRVRSRVPRHILLPVDTSTGAAAHPHPGHGGARGVPLSVMFDGKVLTPSAAAAVVAAAAGAVTTTTADGGDNVPVEQLPRLRLAHHHNVGAEELDLPPRPSAAAELRKHSMRSEASAAASGSASASTPGSGSGAGSRAGLTRPSSHGTMVSTPPPMLDMTSPMLPLTAALSKAAAASLSRAAADSSNGGGGGGGLLALRGSLLDDGADALVSDSDSDSEQGSEDDGGSCTGTESGTCTCTRTATTDTRTRSSGEVTTSLPAPASPSLVSAPAASASAAARKLVENKKEEEVEYDDDDDDEEQPTIVTLFAAHTQLFPAYHPLRGIRPWDGPLVIGANAARPDVRTPCVVAAVRISAGALHTDDLLDAQLRRDASMRKAFIHAMSSASAV